MFPGQGSQEVGMARDLFGSSSYFRALMELGSDLTHEDLEALCLRGPEKKLRSSFFLQPIMVAVSLGYLKSLTERDIEADVVLGHSLGEISSLAAAGVVSDREAISIAVKRGELMDRAAAMSGGSMMAVLRVPLEIVTELIEEVAASGGITLANDNAPDQVVLSGAVEQLKQLSILVASRRLGRCRQLPVSGPWHGPQMSSARQGFEEWISSVDFRSPVRVLILNATGEAETCPREIRRSVSRQLTSPVLWRDCMNTLRGMNIGTLLEVGPGRVLSGLARVNGFAGVTRIFNINNLRGLTHYREEARQSHEE